LFRIDQIMITVTDRVRSWVQRNPSYALHMRHGIINYSSLARRIKPDIEHDVGERVSVEAITIALNRVAKTLTDQDAVDYSAYLGEVSVQSGLGVLTIPQSETSMDQFFTAAKRLHEQNEYMVYTRGLWYTALIGRTEVIDELETALQGTVTSRDIVGITVKLRIGHLPVPGVCAYVLQILANRGINLVEVTSSHNELTVFVHNNRTSEAVALLVMND